MDSAVPADERHRPEAGFRTVPSGRDTQSNPPVAGPHTPSATLLPAVVPPAVRHLPTALNVPSPAAVQLCPGPRVHAAACTVFGRGSPLGTSTHMPVADTSSPFWPRPAGT